MKKSEYKFHRDKKRQINSNARPNTPMFLGSNSNPIFIPKRTKKK
jgi:hypothetical protein